MNAERLKTLRAYGILDTDGERDFDDIVDLASELCGTPISLISLVDEDRQWFKSAKGLDLTETPIDQSICAHAILNGDLFEIEDTALDPRTADNPLCLGDGALRFYAGAPLVTADGMPLGTLCVLDTKPLALDDRQRKALRVLSRQVMNQLDLRIALRTQSVLQAEADHRVKNSLQAIAAVVRVYARSVTDAAAIEALRAIERRIDSVAALHRELQGTAERDTVDAAAYLDRVVRLLSDNAPENISFRTSFAPSVMRSSHAASLAMIISEFTANSLKHAFPDMMPGEIAITLDTIGPGKARLECTDNGIGRKTRDRKSGRAPSRSEGIGLHLVEAAVASLGGFSTSNLTDDGSRLVLDFRTDRQQQDRPDAKAQRKG